MIYDKDQTYTFYLLCLWWLWFSRDLILAILSHLASSPFVFERPGQPSFLSIQQKPRPALFACHKSSRSSWTASLSIDLSPSTGQRGRFAAPDVVGKSDRWQPKSSILFPGTKNIAELRPKVLVVYKGQKGLSWSNWLAANTRKLSPAVVRLRAKDWGPDAHPTWICV